MHTSDDIAHDNAREFADAGHLLGTLVGVLTLGTLLAWSLNTVNRVRLRRRADRSAPVSERLQTWEGEGGRPTAAGTPEPTPALTPDLTP